jgi:general secretion pathway protein J
VHPPPTYSLTPRGNFRKPSSGIHSLHSGFTLIEILVVLIIVGMVSGILLQALERAYRLQERFGTELFDMQQRQMATDWYRLTVKGLFPDYADGRHKFKGDDREFSGLSNNPLSGGYGALTPITWRIRNSKGNQTELVYIENNKEVSLLSWQGQGARFIYLDKEMTPHHSWPPALGLHKQLPTMIRIETDGEDAAILASPMGPDTPLPRLQDM